MPQTMQNELSPLLSRCIIPPVAVHTMAGKTGLLEKRPEICGADVAARDYSHDGEKNAAFYDACLAACRRLTSFSSKHFTLINNFLICIILGVQRRRC